jgi:hypothetical protein
MLIRRRGMRFTHLRILRGNRPSVSLIHRRPIQGLARLRDIRLRDIHRRDIHRRDIRLRDTLHRDIHSRECRLVLRLRSHR